ncbi:MAG: glucuronosyltransferase [Pseudomonadota bacterium]
MLMRATLDRYDTRYATTDRDFARQRGIADPSVLPDCNQTMPFRSLLCALKAVWIVLRLRPHVVLSTGAAPGFFCILAGRMIGARTMWIDSIANGEELSMCGKLSKTFAHQCLTQWEHLSNERSPTYFGSVI